MIAASQESAVADRRYSHTNWLPRYVWFTAVATLFLICSGGMVTSKNVGLAVPDWPTTFGYNMFLFPISRWVGGIFFEHVHRLVASTVGFLTIGLAVWLWRAEPRRWIRNLGYGAVAAVIVQGVLGGLRVTLLKDEIGIFHACLAQAFLALLVIIAVASSRIWEKVAGMAVPPESARRVARAAIITTGLVYLQLALGATMRHQHRDLSILDFPLAYGQIVPDVSAQTIARINAWREARALSDVTAFQIWLQMAHRIGAVLVAAGAVTTFVIAMRDNRRLPRALMRSCAISVCLVFTQVLLGACTIWSNKAADIATAHVAVGATMLAFGVAISALALQIGRPEERSICANPSAPLEQIPVA